MKILVLYLNVGNLNTRKAIKYSKKMGRKFKKKMPKKYCVVVVPVRDATRIERIV